MSEFISLNGIHIDPSTVVSVEVVKASRAQRLDAYKVTLNGTSPSTLWVSKGTFDQLNAILHNRTADSLG